MQSAASGASLSPPLSDTDVTPGFFYVNTAAPLSAARHHQLTAARPEYDWHSLPDRPLDIQRLCEISMATN